MTFSLHFVGVGPQRTGTSWLDKHLRCHPQLYLPREVKETRFFDLHFHKGISWYASHFPAEIGDGLYGEIAPSYFNVSLMPARVHALYPTVKIIINLRDPISRVYSLYRHHIFRGHATGAFRDVLLSTPHLLDSGKYAEYIPKWLDLFQENVAFIVFDDIVQSPRSVLSSIYGFLDVNEVLIPQSSVTKKVGTVSSPRCRLLASLSVKVANTLRRYRLHKVVEKGKALGLNRFLLAGGKRTVPRLTVDEQHWILEQYEIDITFVESLLGRDLQLWRQVTDGL